MSKGRFSRPQQQGQTKLSLSHEELSLLLSGIDLLQTRRKPWHRVVTSDPEFSA
ncbi:MAG: hypothetical protein H0X25_01595 [Acidobacteriales bacterium]|nr:hypothetical protein [Terriglobales bacterium]